MRRRAAVYSSSTRRQAPPPPIAPAVQQPEPPKPIARKPLNMRAVAGALLVLLLGFAASFLRNGSDPLPPPPAEAPALKPSAADAYELIAPSVVRVRASPYDGTEELQGDAPEENIGTGVVMVDTGIILTNLHVVHGAKRLKVVFADGLEADADVIGTRPEHDLAVLQAKDIPDDLFPATMRSTSGLRPGEEVVAVGFPFGIGPSASAGVISGLRREYRSASGERLLTNLIQFDAAVNPGNSGGPLVTTDGAVVGIVTGLLNPTEQRVFVGVGFAVPIENAAGAIGLSPF
jgi:S1-C subfamily serine protease